MADTPSRKTRSRTTVHLSNTRDTRGKREGGATTGFVVSLEQVPADWKPGDVLLNLYEVRSLLGEGGMGKVFRVHHAGWDLELAVKSPRPEIFNAHHGQEEFVAEAETWVNLGLYPHTVSCYYVRVMGGVPRVFAEFVEGGSLSDWIADGRLYQGGQDAALARVIDIAIQFAWGLQYAHEQGLLHRDVKPQNVMMTPGGIAKVTDFGLARAFVRTSTYTDPSTGVVDVGGDALCTPEYASPEQHAGAATLTVSADIWSWAHSVLEMFTGASPTYGPLGVLVLEYYLEEGPRAALAPPMPEPVVALLTQCFALDADDRPASLLDVANLLVHVYATCVGQPYPRSRPAAAAVLADGLNNRAVSLLDIGKRAEAEMALRAALESDPTHVEATYNLGLLLWRQGAINDIDVLASLRNLSNVHGDTPRLKLLAGWVHNERGDAASARFILGEARRRATEAREVHTIDSAIEAIEPGYECVRLLEGHTDFIHAVALRGDGLMAVSASSDRTLRVWDLDSAACVRVLKGHRDKVWAVAIPVDGGLAVSGSQDGTVRVWDLDSGRCLRTLEGHQGGVRAVAEARSGQVVLSGGEDGTVRVWDLQAGTTRILSGQQGGVWGLCVSPDAQSVAVAADDGISLWRLDGSMVWSRAAHDGQTRAIEFTEDGRQLASAGADRSIRIWDCETSQLVCGLTGHTDEVVGLDFAPHGNRLVSCSRDGTLRDWTSPTGRCLRTLDVGGGWVNAVAAAPDGLRIVSASADGTVRVWEVPELLCEAPPMITRPQTSEQALDSNQVVTAALSEAWQAMQQERWFEAVCHLERARSTSGYERAPEGMALWTELGRKLPRADLREAWLLHTLDSHAGAVHSVGMSADGRLAVTGAADGSVQLWDLASGEGRPPLREHAAPVAVVKVRADGLMAASADAAGVHLIWDLHQGTVVRRVEQQGTALALTPDGRFMCATNQRKNPCVTAVADGELIRRLDTSATGVAIRSDGRVVATASEDGSVRLWSVADGRQLAIMRGHSGPVRALSLSPDGTRLVTGGEDQTVRVFEAHSGQSLKVFKGHSRPVTSVAISADARVVVSGGKDKTVRLWDVRGGELANLVGHTDWVSDVAVAAHGRVAVSTGREGTARAWYLDWNVEARPPLDWDEVARPCVQAFLAWYTSYPHVQESLRVGHLQFTADDLQYLMAELELCGYGWLNPSGVMQQLQSMADATDRSQPPGPAAQADRV